MATLLASTGRTTEPAVLSHLFVPEDANLARNVHGGTLLKKIELAGWLAAQRFCTNSEDTPSSGAAADSEPPVLVTARLENTSFVRPAFIGSLGEFKGKVIFASKRSIVVHVDAYSEDIMKGTKVLTNSSTLTYVARQRHGDGSVTSAEVPPFVPETDTEKWLCARARSSYEARPSSAALRTKLDESAVAWSPPPAPGSMPEPHSPAAATSQLVQLMGVPECTSFRPDAPVHGGHILKLMDTAAGICAAKHCRTNVVTVSVNKVDFVRPINSGQLVHVTSRPTFTSSKSMEIEVLVETEDRKGRRPAMHAFFTFVSLGPDGKVLPLPPLNVLNDTETRLFAEGKERYERMKRARAAEMASASG